MKAGIAIDAWKLEIFERHLSQAGYAYEKSAGLTADTLMLCVETDNMIALEGVLRAANTEAAKTRSPGGRRSV